MPASIHEAGHFVRAEANLQRTCAEPDLQPLLLEVDLAAVQAARLQARGFLAEPAQPAAATHGPKD
jgi:hypothetical protein